LITLNNKKLIVILGPTASGKTDLAFKLATKFNGEIICCDSRQVYRDMIIGTASQKPCKVFVSPCLAKLPQHLFNFKTPNKPLNVAIYKKMAEKTIKDIQKRGKIPFLVGGTGLYIKSIVDNLQFPKLKPNPKLRKELEQKTASQLFVIYSKLDHLGAKKIDKNNKRRLIRAIEVCKITGKPFWSQRQKSTPLFDTLQIGVNLPKPELEKRISKRTEQMFEAGLEKEIKNLIKKYGWTQVLRNTIGYSEFQFCKIKKELQDLISLHTMQLAKRQITWFKKDKKIAWVKNYTQANSLVGDFLKNN